MFRKFIPNAWAILEHFGVWNSFVDENQRNVQNIQCFSYKILSHKT